MPHSRFALLTVLVLLAGCRTTTRVEQELGPTFDAESPFRGEMSNDEVAAKEVKQVAFEHQVQNIEPRQIPQVPPESHLSAGSLSLVALEEMALSRNPSIAQSVARIEALRGKRLQSGLPPNLTIGYAAEEIGNDGTAGLQGAYLSQQFVRGGKLQLNRAIVDQEIFRAEQQLAAQRRRVLTDVRMGYYETVIAQRRLALTRDLLRASEEAVNVSRELLEAEEIPRIGLLQTEVEAQNARIQLQVAGNARDAAWRQLASILGQPDLLPQTLEDALSASDIQLEWHEELERLLRESPETSEAFAQLERARWSLDRAYAQVTPDVNVQVTLQQDTTTDTFVSGIQAGLPIPLWNRNQGGIQQARSEIVAAERNIERVQLNLTQRLANAFRSYLNARFQVGTFTDDILPKAQENFDLVSEGFRKGELGYLDMLTAQRTYFQTNLTAIDALNNLWKSQARIEGLLLDNSLQSEIPVQD